MTVDPQIIQRRWPDADTFYAERDHRTRLEVAQLESYVQRPIEIRIDPAVADEATTQRIAVIAASLVARWARCVRVQAPHVRLCEPLASHGNVFLGERLTREMATADPFGAFEVRERVASDADALRLSIGPAKSWDSPTPEEDYGVDAAGWMARGFRGTRGASFPRTPGTAGAAALAAAIGVADLFKRAIGHPHAQWLGPVGWCTWHQGLRSPDDADCAGHRVPEQIDMGNVLLAGVGAVGSAVAYILATSPVTGRLTVLDRDCVETSNLNRSPLFTAVDAALGRLKVEVVRAFLRQAGMEVDVVQGFWRDHEEALSVQPFDVWVSLTNEDGAWASVPFLLPPVVLHGTTTSGWGVSCGRHIPRIEDCTACRLPRPHAEFRGPCAEGEIAPATQEAPVRAALPFLSVAAGALVVAELSKLGLDGATDLPNSVSADFRVGLPTVMSLSVGPTATCRGCAMAMLPAWEQRGGRGRYRELSAPSREAPRPASDGSSKWAGSPSS